MATLSAAEFQTRLLKGQINGLYLFDGPEEWLKRRAVEQIIERVMPPEGRELNLEKFHGDDTPGSQAAQALQSFPFCADHRLVIVFDVQNMSAADRRILASACGNVPPTTIGLFLHDGKSSVRDELTAQISSVGTVVTFWPPFPNQMPQWISNVAQEKGKRISLEAARWLSEECGDLQTISNELDKLILMIGDRNEISMADVHILGSPDGTGDFDDLERALWTRKLRDALWQTNRMDRMGLRAEAIFPVFERVFRRLVLGYYLIEEKGLSRTEIYQAFGLRGKTRQGYLDSGLRNYSRSESEEAIDQIVRAHLDLKTGLLSSDLASTLLAYRICGKGEKKALTFR